MCQNTKLCPGEQNTVIHHHNWRYVSWYIKKKCGFTITFNVWIIKHPIPWFKVILSNLDYFKHSQCLSGTIFAFFFFFFSWSENVNLTDFFSFLLIFKWFLQDREISCMIVKKVFFFLSCLFVNCSHLEQI